jgi:hypothetical protein
MIWEGSHVDFGYLRLQNQLDAEGIAKGLGGNHSSAGAAFAEERFGLLGRVLAYLIAGHQRGC